MIISIENFNALSISNIIRLNLLHQSRILLNSLNLRMILLFKGVNLGCGICTRAKNHRKVQQHAQNC